MTLPSELPKLPDWVVEQMDCCGVHAPDVLEALRIAWAAAREKAAGIAESHECSIARNTVTCNCDIEIAERIRGMEPGK